MAKTESGAGVNAPDWGLGRYELTAAQLLPAAQAVVDHADPLAGEQVLDLGCGTGNAALLAARRGAAVTGVDPAQRLLDVAAARAWIPRGPISEAARLSREAIAGRAVLEPTGKGQELSERVREIFEAGDEQPGGFRVTSRYVIATATRA